MSAILCHRTSTLVSNADTIGTWTDWLWRQRWRLFMGPTAWPHTCQSYSRYCCQPARNRDRLSPWYRIICCRDQLVTWWQIDHIRYLAFLTLIPKIPGNPSKSTSKALLHFFILRTKLNKHSFMCNLTSWCFYLYGI